MALKEYQIAGAAGLITVKLDEVTAASYGDAAKLVQRKAAPDKKAAPKPANKARTARNK